MAHDIGNMVGFAFAAQYPQRTHSLVLIDAPLPGVGPWDEILKNPLLWHFRFGGPDMERLVAGRERIYLDWFWNEFSANPATSPKPRGSITPGFTRCRARCMRASPSSPPSIRTRPTIAILAQRGKLKMPVLALGGEKSFGATMAAVARFAADDVEGGIVPDAGH